jgi:ubiquinone/menaquinone biosynthesis C-methylase UbiE
MAIQTPTTSIDPIKSEAFAGRLVGLINSAALSLMISIGHKTRLFDTMAGLDPSTSTQIGQAAGLQERYVREWLGAMVTGQIIDYNSTNKTYHLPAEHAAWLTRAAGPNNFAFQPSYLVLATNVQDQIINCFYTGGGVPYSAFANFQGVMFEGSASGLDSSLIQATLPLIPGLIVQLKAGIDVADIGCGSGHAINIMAQAFPNSRFVGYDFSEDGIAAAQSEAMKLGLTNASFMVKDAAQLDVEGQYDFVTAFDAIHDQVKPSQVLKGIAKSLRPDGFFLMVDIKASSQLENNMDHPMAPLLYTLSLNHCMTVSLAGGGEGLGTMWGEEKACQMLEEAGFNQIEVQQLEGDMLNNYYIAKKSS